MIYLSVSGSHRTLVVILDIALIYLSVSGPHRTLVVILEINE